MNQRTCNIIMCCKGHCRIVTKEVFANKREQAIAAYMAKECGLHIEDYDKALLENILETAMFDYIDTADKPSADLRNLFRNWTDKEPTMVQRIITMFALITVRESESSNKLVNGFTEELLEQSKKDLEEK